MHNDNDERSLRMSFGCGGHTWTETRSVRVMSFLEARDALSREMESYSERELEGDMVASVIYVDRVDQQVAALEIRSGGVEPEPGESLGAAVHRVIMAATCPWDLLPDFETIVWAEEADQ